jgi:hypothetical protein
MKSATKIIGSLAAVAALAIPAGTAMAKAGGGDGTIPITTTVTATVDPGKRMPGLGRDDIVVKRGSERLRVTEFVPAQGVRAGMDLFILLDDASGPTLGSQFGDLKQFINSLPASTSVAVGYMRNATVSIAQPLTRDHARAADALRLPMGSPGAYGSPYLSVMELMKRWPADGNRREVVMISDGVDRSGRHWNRSWRGLQTNPDVETASGVAQRTGTVIHTIYTPGARHGRRNYWRAQSGQVDMARLSARTGGMSFFLGLQAPVGFAPYLKDLQRGLANQYLLSFDAKPGRRPQFQTFSLDTEVAGVRLVTQDAVWIPLTR